MSSLILTLKIYLEFSIMVIRSLGSRLLFYRIQTLIPLYLLVLVTKFLLQRIIILVSSGGFKISETNATGFVDRYFESSCVSSICANGGIFFDINSTKPFLLYVQSMLLYNANFFRQQMAKHPLLIMFI